MRSFPRHLLAQMFYDKRRPLFNLTTTWMQMVREERQEILRELSILSAEQRKVLIAVANGQTSELTGKIFLKKINLSSSSVIEALKILEHRDYLEKRETGEYHVIDPLLATALRLYFANLP